jgi:hypothetical protein
MQHNILQALHALQQQQQQRQQQEQVQQQQLLQQQQQQQQEQAADMPEQHTGQHISADRWSEEDCAAAAAGLPASKRLRLTDELGSGSNGSLLEDVAAAGGAASMSNDAGLLMDQHCGQGMVCTDQVQQVQQQDRQQRQQHGQQQQQQQRGVDSIDLVIEDSQEDPEDRIGSDQDMGRAAAGHCNMFSADLGAAGVRDKEPWAAAAGSSGGGSSLPSGGNSMQQGPMQSDSIPAAPSSGMGGSMMSLTGVSQELSGLQDPSGLLSGQQQRQQQDADPFSVTGTPAAARGAAVSTLSALINSMSSQQQQQQQRSQSPAVPAFLQRRTRGSSNSRFFTGGSSSCSPALLGVEAAAGDAAFLQRDGAGLGLGSDPLLMPSSLPSLPSSGGLSLGVLGQGSGLGLSSEAGPASLSGLGVSSEEDVLAGLGSSRPEQQQRQQQCVVDELDEQVEVSPPKMHHLALGGSSSQAWRRLQRSLRGGAGLSRRQVTQQRGQDLDVDGRQQQRVEQEDDDMQQQQQQYREHQAVAADTAAREAAEQEPAPSSSGGSSSNDENAEPADAGDIHSIAHIRQYAKLAAKVVNKVHKQQEQQCTQQQQQRVATQQQVSPLGLSGSAANTAAAAAGGGAQQRPGQVAAQRHLRSSSNSSRGKGTGKGGSGSKGQPRKSLTHLYAMRYDPDLLFVPEKPLADDAAALEEAATAAAPAAEAAGELMQDADSDVELIGEGLGSGSSGPFGQQPRRASSMLGRRLGGGSSSSSRGGIAARPFKAPWAATADADSSLGVDDAAADGGFGAFGMFACGGGGESGAGTLAGAKRGGSKRGLGSSWLR